MTDFRLNQMHLIFLHVCVCVCLWKTYTSESYHRPWAPRVAIYMILYTRLRLYLIDVNRQIAVLAHMTAHCCAR